MAAPQELMIIRDHFSILMVTWFCSAKGWVE